MKKRFIVLIVIGGAIIIFVEAIIVLSFPWLMIGVGGMMREDPPQPNVTYGEFPFEITYILRGETITVRDVCVCEYDGVGWNEGQGKHRTWNSYIKSTGEDRLVLLTDGNKQIYCTVGSGGYYMGDQPSHASKTFTPELRWIEIERDGTVSYPNTLSDEAQDYYGIYLVSWTFSDPIVNSFE